MQEMKHMVREGFLRVVLFVKLEPITPYYLCKSVSAIKSFVS